MQKLGTCVTDIELNDYLNNELSSENKERIEKHLKECNECLEKLVFAYNTVKEYDEPKLKGEKSMKKDWKKNIWLIGAIVAFILSFVVSRYFIQLLVATILMGMKWIFDSINARILIMIYDAWKKGGEKEASKVLNSFGDRFNG